MTLAGRVHSAMVAKVNPECRSVTVEWSERGETKGKEIELAAIMQLNGELFNATPEQPEPKKQATVATNLSRVSVGHGVGERKSCRGLIGYYVLIVCLWESATHSLTFLS